MALTGKEFEFTSGPIGRAIVLLAVPMVLELVMESVFALTDAFFVSHLGTDAIATVGLTEAMISWLFQLPLARFLSGAAGFGPAGVFAAITIAESLIALVGIAVFRRGRWKSRVV